MRQKNEWLQALRALAALAVLFFHMKPHWETSSWLHSFMPLIKNGFMGVDIFFVLSGYVVYQSADHENFRLKPFLLRRALRIYLGYWPVLAFVAILTFSAIQLDYSAWPFPDAKKLFLSIALLSPSLSENWLPTAWTLVYELYFYVWIAVLFICHPAWRVKISMVLFLTLLCWNLGWWLWGRDTVLAGQQPLDFILSGLGMEFMAGAWLAHWHTRLPAERRAGQAGRLALVGAVLVLLGSALGDRLFPLSANVSLWRAGTFGLVGLGFMCLALACSDKQWRVPATLVALGDSSYALYLLHPLLLDASSLPRRMAIAAGSVATLTAFLLALPVFICIFSWLWFRHIELPLQEKVRSYLFSPVKKHAA